MAPHNLEHGESTMKAIHRLLTVATIGGIAALGFAGSVRPLASAEREPAVKQPAAKQPDRASVERARKLVHLLDNIYKQTIVLITDKYVHDKDDFPAGSAAVLLFANISKSGSHQVRLIDATGEPYHPDNVANSDFEKEAIQQLKAGSKTFERVALHDGRYQLHVATPVPVVMKKCILCHEHYADAKEGEPVGAISYIVPIE